MITIKSDQARIKLNELIDPDMRTFLIAASEAFGKAESIAIECPEWEAELKAWREGIGKQALDALRANLSDERD